MDHQSPGILTSESELDFSSPNTPEEVLSQLREILKDCAEQHPRIAHASAKSDSDGAGIVVSLEIMGNSFGEADLITRNILDSLSRLLSGSTASQKGGATQIHQVSQTLIPA